LSCNLSGNLSRTLSHSVIDIIGDPMNEKQATRSLQGTPA